MSRVAPINTMRFSLRTLVIVLTVAPPILAVAWAFRSNLPAVAMLAVYVALALVVIVVNFLAFSTVIAEIFGRNRL